MDSSLVKTEADSENLPNASDGADCDVSMLCDDSGQVLPAVQEAVMQLVVENSAATAAGAQQPPVPALPDHSYSRQPLDPNELLLQMLNAEIARRNALVSDAPAPAADGTSDHLFRPIEPQPVSSEPVSVLAPKAMRPGSGRVYQTTAPYQTGPRVYRAIAPKPAGIAQQGQPCVVHVTSRQPEPIRPSGVEATNNLDVLAQAATNRPVPGPVRPDFPVMPPTGSTGFPTDTRIRQWMIEVGVPLSAQLEAYSYARYLMKKFVQQIFTDAHVEAVRRAGAPRAMVTPAHMQAVLRPHRRNRDQTR